MIDHEFRIITPEIRKLVKSKNKHEVVLLQKISHNFISKNNLLKTNANYFKKNKKILKIFFRGLPVNNFYSYFKQENEMSFTFDSLCKGRKIIGKRMIQLPNPDFVSFNQFKNYLQKENNISGFELIPSWHKKNIRDKKYTKFLSFISEMKLPLSLEIDYFFRNTQDNLSNFFYIIKKFNKIKYWLPHLGCGVFLHWDKVMNYCKYKPILLSSTKNLDIWANIFKLKNFKEIPIKFATDHPFNDDSSEFIYKSWIKHNLK